MSFRSSQNELHDETQRKLFKKPAVVISILRDSILETVSPYTRDVDKNSASQIKLSAERKNINAVKSIYVHYYSHL